MLVCVAVVALSGRSVLQWYIHINVLSAHAVCLAVYSIQIDVDLLL